ncbi:restriction endonuclease subunit S [Staphylococcus sp. 17KM0847]|nr:restriction endonuclease subunit S [Staphylococcus sp. 17KM0847]QLK85240.1 restriction endonuclease subunit S [Staphylococcus sp. 17KM0847]
MTNQTKNIPTLRFPEFDSVWKITTIENLFDFKNGLNKEKKYFGYGTPIVNFKDVFNNRGIITNNLSGKVDVTEKELENYSVEKGDVFFTRTSEVIEEIGYSSVIMDDPKNTVFSGFVLRARPKKGIDLISNKFKRYVFSTHSFRKEMITKSSMTTRALTSGTAINKMQIIYPKSFSEQQKIGEFFSKLDQQIELEEQKLAKLEEKKKGYMQKIFSQELRFKDENGNEYPEWTKMKLGNLGTTFTGLSGKTKEDFGHGDAKFITYMNVFKNTIAKLEMTTKVDVKDNERQSKVEYKDILFTTSSETPNEAGMSSIWLYKSENMYLNSFCFGFKVNYKDIEPIYLARYLRSEDMRKRITVLSQGSTRFNISKREMMQLTIDFPIIEEQIKIVKFLDKFEVLIEKQDQKINGLQNRKKGLLQKMFV